MYNSLAATTKNTNDLSINKDSDELLLTSKVQENLAEFSDPSMPVIDYTTMTVPNPLKPSNLGSKIHDLKAFLQRPVLCPAGSISWTTALGRGKILMQMDVPSLLLNLPMYKEKIAGFFGFKGDLVLTFQTNAQKFQQGMVLISVLPCGPMLSTSRVACITSHIELLSQLPSVRHDISQTNETTIKVPFTSPMFMHPLDASRAKDYATVYYTVYSPLTGSTINYRCWCHFENVEMLYPMAQSSGGFAITKKAGRYTPADKEDGGGIVSTPVSTIASGIRQLGDNIPLISSFAAPTAWFLDSLSKGFASFGLTNPVDTSTRHSVVPRVFSHPYNTDINDTVDSFGYIAGNKVAHLPGFSGSDADEMSIQHIASIPSFLTKFNWSVTDGPQTELVSLVIGKTGFYSANTVVTTAATRFYRIYAPFAYVANRFSYWRGSIKYKFYAVKTNFHTGRLLFSFSPSYLAANNTYAKADYNTRYIWDLSQTSTFEVTIPYVSPQSWCSWDDFSNVGTLKAFILNELETVSGVSNTVEVLVEISAGADFEVAVAQTGSQGKLPAIIAQSPLDLLEKIHINYSKFKQLKTNNVDPNNNSGLQNCPQNKKTLLRYRKYSNIKKQRDIGRERDRKYSIVAQSAELTMGGYDDDTIMNINQNAVDTAGYNALFTTGETIKSLRQILKRSNTKYLGDPAAAGANDFRFFTDTHQPFYTYLKAATAESLLPARLIADDYDYFSGIFALYRGGMIYRAIGTATTNCRPRVVLTANGNTVVAPDFSTTSLPWVGTRQPATIQSSYYVQGGVDVHVPFYSPTHTAVYCHIPYNGLAYTSPNPFDFGHSAIQIISRSPTDNRNTMDITRQIADDFSMGCFIGVLPVLDTDLSTGGPLTLQ